MNKARFLMFVTVLLTCIQLNLRSQTEDVQVCPPLTPTCAPPSITNIGTIYGCVGSTFNFTPSIATDPTQTIVSYTWTPTSGLTPSTGTGTPGATSILTTSVCQTYSLAVTSLGENLILNGTFVDPGGDPTLHHCFCTMYGNGSGSPGCSSDHIKVGGAWGECSPCVTEATDWSTHTADGTECLDVHANGGPVTYPFPYFWGQRVNMCAGTYVCTYWVRLMQSYTELIALPKIALVVGQAGVAPAYDLESGWAGSGTYIEDISPKFGLGYYMTCNSYWEERIDTFYYPGSIGGQSFICMVDSAHSGARYGVDDITLRQIFTSKSACINLCPEPQPNLTITSNPFACLNSPFTFVVHGAAGDSFSYHITRPGASTIYGAAAIGTSGTTNVVAPASSVVGTICLDITNLYHASATGICPFNLTTDITECVLIHNPPVPPVISAPLVKCAADSAFTVSVTDTSVSSGTLTYHWSISSPYYISGTSSASETVATLSYPGTITLTCVATNTCGSNTTTATITVNPTPAAPTLAGSEVICTVGGTTTLTATATYSGTITPTYVWSPPAGLSCTTCDPVTAHPSVTSVYSVYATALGCPGPAFVFTVGVHPIVIAPISPIPVCNGLPVSLTATVTGATAYVWNGPGGYTSSVLSPPAFTPTASGTYTLTASNIYCAPSTATVSVTVNPLPGSTSLTGSESICPGGTTTLTATSAYSGTATVTYAWGSPTGLSCTLCNPTIASPSSTTTYTVHATALGCAGPTLTFTVAVHPVTITTVTGTPSICAGSAATLTAVTSGATIFVWTGPGGVVGTAATIMVSPTVTTTYTFTASNSYGCSASATLTLIVYPVPNAGVISGADTVCVGSTITMTESVGGGSWSTTSSATGTITTSGDLTGLSAGYVIVAYNVSNNFCFNTAYDTVSVVNPPIIPAINGIDTICFTGHTTLSDPDAGGTWVSYSPSIAIIDPATGYVSGITPGLAIIGYRITTYCGTQEVRDTVAVMSADPPIQGLTAVCSGSTTTLTNQATGGTWSSSNPAVASIDPVTGVVSGIASGTATITYVATNVCGAFTVTATVGVNTPPYITTNFKIACQSLATDPETKSTYIISDTSGCIQVCDSSVIRYYGNGVDSSMFSWAVTGGTVIHTYPGNDSIDVFWPIVGTTGSIILSDTFSHCIAQAAACIQVIEKPHAGFIPSSTTACVGSAEIFLNTSTADSLSPIVSYYWNFGDGTGSDLVNPSHVFAHSGYDTVILVVKNACNCSDTERVVIHVVGTSGPVISCASVVCDSQKVTYSIPTDGCTGYSWSTIGGTILSGTGTTSIVVDWDDVDSIGYGAVFVVDPCSACPSASVIKVPVILNNAPIEGPDVICVNQQYEYTLPLWPATQYKWGVLTDPGAVVGYNNDHALVVKFSSPGTYTLHAWYQNDILLCGGNVDKTITVKPSVAIIGPTTICQNSTETYTVSGTSVTWTLINLTGSVVSSSSGTSFTYAFTTPGTYLLSASGTVCSEPITINVMALPAVPDSIAGPDTVCLNRGYTYTALNPVAGETYQWTASHGTVSPASGSAIVNVTWTGGGPLQLSVSRVNTAPPYCVGLPKVLHVVQEVINPNVVGDTLPCANAYRSYYTNYTRGETYDWSIYPNTDGSVVAGNHTTAVSVLWNNVTVATPAAVVLTVHKCDSIVSDTFHVSIQPDPLVAITGTPDPVCPSAPVAFTASGSDSAYIWNFGDGTPSVITSVGSTSHPFPLNTTTGNIFYTIEVTALPGASFGCPASGTATYIVTVLPGPVAFASTAYPDYMCGASDYLLVGTVTDNVVDPVYQWYAAGVSLGTATTQSISSVGTYNFKVTDSNGCSATSNTLTFTTYCPSPAGSGGEADSSDTVGAGGTGSGCAPRPIVTSSHSCTTITMSETGGSSPTWIVPPGVSTTVSGTTASGTYDEPGIYHFILMAYVSGGCLDTVEKVDTVGIVPNFRYGLSCAAGGLDSVFLKDFSAYLPFWHITGISWNVDGTVYSGGSNLTVLLSGAGSHVVTETVSGTCPGGTFSCSYTNSITLPALPHASFTDAVSPICSEVPIDFTATSTAGIVKYYWDFGDVSSSLLQNPEKSYFWNTTIEVDRVVTLTVTDSIGCTADTTGTVVIRENIYTGNIGPLNQTVCSNATPLILSFTPSPAYIPSSYLWSTGATTSTIAVDTSGSFWLTVVGPFQCQVTVPSPIVAKVKVLIVPTAQITGLQNYCIGQTISLSAYAGNNVFYKWYKGGAADGTSASITEPASTVGTFNYHVVIGIVDSATLDTCYDTSTNYQVFVHPLPANPVITDPKVLDCSTYQIELAATASESGTFNWSDGTVGALDNSIYNGGDYEVWFTNVYGCISSATRYVPMSPDYYFQYFPTGCYNICLQQMPLTLYGPPNVDFTDWQWVHNGTVVSEDEGDAMGSYAISDSGIYDWTLNNGLCTQTSGDMDVTKVNCDSCSKVDLTATMSCEPSNPASYSITVNLAALDGGATYTLGTNMGPIVPFSGTLPTGSIYHLTLTFTTFTPPPATVEVEVNFTLPSGARCFQQVAVSEPSCSWVSERNAATDTAQNSVTRPLGNTSNAMLVFPNPASGAITVSYNYGTGAYSDRALEIYDAMGRKVESTVPADVTGSWNLNSTNWTPGIYIIRMSGDGQTLQTQRVVVAH